MINMFKRALAVLIAIYVLPLILLSCDCKERIQYCHTIDTISLTPFDNAGNEPVAVTNGQVIAKAFILQLNVNDNMAICRREIPFMNTAYATTKDDCEDHQYKDQPVIISITSNKDFDAAHKAGTELRALFKGPDASSITAGNKYDFFMLHEPADTGTHIFSLKLTMQDQKVLEASSQPIKLLK